MEERRCHRRSNPIHLQKEPGMIIAPCRCERCKALDAPKIHKLKREIAQTEAAQRGTPVTSPKFDVLCSLLKRRKRELALETFLTKSRIQGDPCWPVDGNGNAPVHLLLRQTPPS